MLLRKGKAVNVKRKGSIAKLVASQFRVLSLGFRTKESPVAKIGIAREDCNETGNMYRL